MHKKISPPSFSYEPFVFECELYHANGSRFSIHARDKELKTETIRHGDDSQSQKIRFSTQEQLRISLFQEILKARKEGFFLEQSLTPEELFTRKTIPAKDVDYMLEGFEYHKKVLFFEGDLYIEGDVNLENLLKQADALIVYGNMIVNGGIYNPEGDYGADLYVRGNLLADFLVIGGSEVYIKNQFFTHVLVLKYYNHGKLDYGNGSGRTLIIDDEDSTIKYGKYIWYDIKNMLHHIGVNHDFVCHFDENRIPPPEGSEPWSPELEEYVEDAHLEINNFINRLLLNDFENGRFYMQKLLFSALPEMINDNTWL